MEHKTCPYSNYIFSTLASVTRHILGNTFKSVSVCDNLDLVTNEKYGNRIRTRDSGMNKESTRIMGRYNKDVKYEKDGKLQHRWKL